MIVNCHHRIASLKFYNQITQDVQAFVLNFHGRVKKASVKNFQLIEESNGNNTQFSRSLYFCMRINR